MDSPSDQSTERRTDDTVFAPPARGASRVVAALSQTVGAREITAAVVGVVLTVFGALGFTVRGPGKQIDAISSRLDTVSHNLESRLEAAEQHAARADTATTVLRTRVDSINSELRFIGYLQCVQFRRSDPAAVPPDCAPAERAWTARRGRNLP